jgi:PAS domain S-box-containing protein
MFGLTKDQFLGRTSLDPAWKVIREDGFDYLGDEHPSMAALKTGNPVHNKVAGVLNPIKQDYVWLNINELINRKRNRFELEFKMKHKDGHWVDILSRANAVFNDNGEAIRIIGTHVDISERKVAERQQAETRHELENRNHFIEMILDSLPIGMGVNYVDSGEVTYLNNKFAEIYGWSKADFPNVIVFFNKVFPDPKKREILKARIMNDIASGDPDRMIWEDLEITTSKGDKRIVTAFNIPIFDQNLMISTVQDVTEKRKLEAHVQQTQRMEAIGTLAGGIAHDFNNMLSIIIGNISYVISICNKNSEFEDVLLEALGGAKRAQDLTQQLLTFTKGGEPIKKIHDVNKLVEEAAGFVTHGSKSKCVFKISKAQLMSEVDAGQINQVMSNLIINSDQAMPDGGIINLHTDIVRIEPGNSFEIAAGEYIKITIEDQGIGIEKRHIPKIFEPYFTTKQEGSGLGLATVYSIIKRHHGHITAYSEIGKGTVFHIYLPSSSKSSVESESNLALRHKGHGKILSRIPGTRIPGTDSGDRIPGTGFRGQLT